jgi:hypothetical protein
MTHHQAKFFLSFFILLANADSFASNKDTSHSKLTMHGEVYENSCDPTGKHELVSSIVKSSTKDPRILQEAVELILCAEDTPQNVKKVIRFIDKVITTTYEGTGEEKVVGKSSAKLEVARDIMAKGRAWSTTLQFNDNEVTLQYFSSEACVESLKFRNSKSSWLVQEIGGACD